MLQAYNAYGSFSPDKFPGLIAALDGRNLVGANGSAISAWADPLAGSSFVQSTGAQKPTLVTNGLGSFNVARFVRANSTNLATPLLLTTSLTYTIFLVVKLANTSNTEVVFNNGNTGGNGYGIYSSTAPHWHFLNGGQPGSDMALASSNTNWTIIGVMRNSSNAFHYKIAGVAGDLTIGDANPVGNNTSIGGDVGSNNHYIDGDIFSLLWWDNPIDSSGHANFDAVYSYLSSLTGLA